jgi:hypothetical protein
MQFLKSMVVMVLGFLALCVLLLGSGRLMIVLLVTALCTMGTTWAKTFQCGAGDVSCLIASITEANGDGQKNTITLATGTLTLRGLTIRGGGVGLTQCCFSGGGAGIFVHGGTATIVDSIITANITSGDRGGGLGNVGGQVRLARSLVTGNSAFHEGGGLSNEGGTMTIVQTAIAENGADNTGGLYIASGTVTVTDSTIADNEGGWWAQGIFIGSGTLTLTNSTVARNEGHGDGSGGGALWSTGGATLILNSTLAENRLSGGGGGGILADPPGLVTLQNTILAKNIAGPYGLSSDCSGPVVSLGNNLIGDPTGCTITLQATDRTGDPGLGDFTDDGTPGNGHFPLLSTSQAIDAGNDAACPRRDQLLEPRVGPCDIGAIEFQGDADAASAEQN